MKINFNNVDLSNLNSYKEKSLDAFSTLMNKDGEGNDFLGWIDRPNNLDVEEYERIKEASKKIQNNSDCLVTIGIGGSYLGTKAVDYAMKGYFPKNDKTELIYAGHQISGEYLHDLLDYLKEKEFSINVISKSGTTTEPAIAFRFVKELLEEKYGKEEARERIFVTTDRQKGALKDLATKEGYETFVVPDDIGGRFSVISAVGLLPLCVAGVDIDEFVQGFKKGIENYTKDSFDENVAIQYAAIRNMLNDNGKDIEVLVNYEPKLKYVSEWWKQLFAESEGKDGKGIFPVSVNNTTDLHSVGQMIQDGKRNLFETVLKVENADKDLTIIEDEENLDGLNYLAGKKMSFVNEKAMEGTIIAHVKGNVPNILLSLDDVSAQSLGELFYFFEIVVGVSGYMQGVNPFNQPGVEEYKSQMFKLLGKPGY
ncbi:glucose-6-phosphate isomerase [Anaerococcus jeddahensis]|uniref:glucose-6-phosphate isomerase n=1 Tax=Anaerococcus jeddahensis TaxID=1673719 RepID=UPI0006726065|nr:glucose-6-phosphate isomerase [Anaerococcus jeddahensis]